MFGVLALYNFLGRRVWGLGFRLLVFRSWEFLDIGLKGDLRLRAPGSESRVCGLGL